MAAMPRLAANLSLLFTDRPLLQRLRAAREAGFEAVEVQFPYAEPAERWRDELQRQGLQLVLHNLPAGDWAAGDRGLACLPGREDEFRAGVAQAIAYARALGAPQLNCLAGLAPPGVPADRLDATLLGNLRHAARELGRAGLRLLIEPINTFDMPGFHVHHTAHALRLMDVLAAEGLDNVFLQYDCYHAQRMEGELAGTLARCLPRIGHVQIADNPGRHEPGTGEINYAFLLPHLDHLGYTGWVGCEYLPAAGTEAGLGWRERLLPGR
jgi:hydroxypyruvate isomerase